MTNTDEKLANLIKSFINSRREEKEEKRYKDKPKKNKAGIVTNGAFNIRLIAIAKNLISDKQAISEIEKSKRSKEQSSLAFQQEKFQRLLDLLSDHTTNKNLIDLKSEHNQSLLELDRQFDVVTWLNENTPNAKDISFATHVAKLTHSSSKSTSILDVSSTTNNRFLTTNSLKHADVDTASSNAASLPVAELLKLSIDDVSVLDCLKSGDITFLTHLTDDKTLSDSWFTNLKQAYDSQQKKSYFLNKQIYFPIENNEYHLLLPLKSSSLVQAIHLEHQKYFQDDAKQTRDQRKKGLYFNKDARSYPNKANIHVTGSNHSNASSLNGQRGGRIVLFYSAPPNWQSSTPSISDKETIFDKNLSYELRYKIKALKDYLLVLKKEDLSINKPERNAAVVKKLSAISEAFFDYIEQLRMNQTDTGWTLETSLNPEQKWLLEPIKEDKTTIEGKTKKVWLKKLSNDYGRWLNEALIKDKTLQLTPIHSKLWSEQFQIMLKEYIAIEEAIA